MWSWFWAPAGWCQVVNPLCLWHWDRRIGKACLPSAHRTGHMAFTVMTTKEGSTLVENRKRSVRPTYFENKDHSKSSFLFSQSSWHLGEIPDLSFWWYFDFQEGQMISEVVGRRIRSWRNQTKNCSYCDTDPSKVPWFQFDSLVLSSRIMIIFSICFSILAHIGLFVNDNCKLSFP